MARSFRFRVCEGREIVAFNETEAWTCGAGYALVMTEEEAARFLRNRSSRLALELVEVVEDEAALPADEPGDRE
jgi:hypothetical protein